MVFIRIYDVKSDNKTVFHLHIILKPHVAVMRKLCYCIPVRSSTLFWINAEFCESKTKQQFKKQTYAASPSVAQTATAFKNT